MLNFSGLGLVTKRRAMAELEPERETVDSEKVQPGEFTKKYLFLENLVKKD